MPDKPPISSKYFQSPALNQFWSYTRPSWWQSLGNAIVPMLGNAVGGPIGSGAANTFWRGVSGQGWDPRNALPFNQLIWRGRNGTYTIGFPNPGSISGLANPAPSITSGNWFQGMLQLPQQNYSANYTGNPMALALSQLALSAGTYGMPNRAGVAPINTAAMNANTAPGASGISKYTMVGNPQQAAPQGFPSSLNPRTPYQTAFNPNAFGGNFDTSQRFFQEFGGGLRDGDPLGAGSCFSGNTRLKDLGHFDQYSAGQTVALPDGRKAQVLVHDHDGPMRDMGGGELVTLDHPFEHNGQLVPASSLFPNEVSFTGKVYNLHILTDQESERLYDLENGYRAHNKIPQTTLTGSAAGWFA